MPPLADYPDSFGAHRASVFAHVGPTLYAAFTDTPVAGGDVVEAREGGLTWLDFLVGGISDSGTYLVQAVVAAGHSSSSKAGAPSKTWVLRWVVVSTGAEAGAIDLSGETVRLFGIGRF